MKVVLAYSGGLDTSVALHWLKEHYSADVVAFCAGLGQLESLEDVRHKAASTGASCVYVEDLRSQYLTDFVFPALRAAAAYEGQYLLAAPLARPLIAKRLVEIAHMEGADAVAHGATGKGNDQVRFYSSIVAHDPGLTVLAPVMDWELTSREAEMAYARRHGIPVDASVATPYSIDTNIWGSSVECGPLDDVGAPPPGDVYLMTRAPQIAPDTPADVTIDFDRGTPTSVDGARLSPVALVARLNTLGGTHGIGRLDIIENRLVGIKTRGVYECPGGALLHCAHKQLEDLVLDRDTLHFKRSIAQRYSELVYNGLWYSPLREALDAFVSRTQERVSGAVTLQLYKGSATVLRRESPHAMYDVSMSTYDERDRFDHRAGQGFAYVWSMALRIGAAGAPRVGSAAPTDAPLV